MVAAGVRPSAEPQLLHNGSEGDAPSQSVGGSDWLLCGAGCKFPPPKCDLLRLRSTHWQPPHFLPHTDASAGPEPSVGKSALGPTSEPEPGPGPESLGGAHQEVLVRVAAGTAAVAGSSGCGGAVADAAAAYGAAESALGWTQTLRGCLKRSWVRATWAGL